MSVMKSQIHDGFATIRHRGLHRSRSRAEQLERRLPRCESTSEKTSTDPLYENNNDLYYNFRNSAIPTDDTPHHVIGLPEPLYTSQFKSLSKSSNSFKSADSDRGRTSPFVGPQSPDSLITDASFLYQRPESPVYGGGLSVRDVVKHNATNAEHSFGSPPSRMFTPTYYRKGDGGSSYALEELSPVKPPVAPPSIRSKTLNYRKSYSHPGRPLTEAKRPVADLYYNTNTNYYSPEELYAKTMARQPSRDVSDTQRVMASIDKRFATLSYPKESQRLKQQRFSSAAGTVATDRSVDDVEYMDPLDCKIGCQTTLRSKPRIPWYELAIRKENRRQSCPPEYEVCHSEFKLLLT